MARAGLCSRREAERWIEQGRVKVNGQILKSAACTVSEADDIRVDGKKLPDAGKARLFLYHKPAGLVTTHSDERDRPTVFERLPQGLPRLISVGRLDLNSEGLLLLTNDGELARYLELPSTGWTRRYRVRVMGTIDTQRLENLKKGITIEGVNYKSIEVVVDQDQKSANTWLTVTLKEGKNREIRRVMQAMELHVGRLIRTAYGPFNLDLLERGAVREIREHVMKDQVAGYFKGKS